jgi:hypothetical protein
MTLRRGLLFSLALTALISVLLSTFFGPRVFGLILFLPFAFLFGRRGSPPVHGGTKGGPYRDAPPHLDSRPIEPK